MSRMRRPRAISIHALFVLALLAAAPGVVFAQGGSVGMPDNAHAKSYGSGWECDQGYREAQGTCATVKVPATNAFYGRGYRAVKETCAAVKVPENAHLDYSGNGWECNRP